METGWRRVGGVGVTPLRGKKVVFLSRSKEARVEVLELVNQLESDNELSEVLMVVRGTDGQYSFLGATADVLCDPARVIGQLEMLKHAILAHVAGAL